MTDLEDRPENFLAFLPLVRGVLGVLHLVAELQESVFEIVEAVWWRLSIFR